MIRAAVRRTEIMRCVERLEALAREDAEAEAYEQEYPMTDAEQATARAARQNRGGERLSLRDTVWRLMGGRGPAPALPAEP